jgi:hypothetical protein
VQPAVPPVPAATPDTPDVSWSSLIPDEQWNIYAQVLERAYEKKIPFALGGGFAFSHYAQRWRNTKDIDLYVLPDDRDRMIAVVQETGLVDYYDVLPYDRKWIFRSHNREGVIVDIMWQMANYRAQVDHNWLSRGEVVQVHGMQLRLLPVEELLWAKLYILQRERCDWGDLLNILFTRGPSMDWNHLIDAVGEDYRVLAALVEVFTWACPERAREFPRDVWRRLNVKPPREGKGDVDHGHIRLLDSRDWFGPNQPAPETQEGKEQT